MTALTPSDSWKRVATSTSPPPKLLNSQGDGVRRFTEPRTLGAGVATEGCRGSGASASESLGSPFPSPNR